MTPQFFLSSWRSNLRTGDPVFASLDTGLTEGTFVKDWLTRVEISISSDTTLEVQRNQLYPPEFVSSHDGEHKLAIPKTITHTTKQLLKHPEEQTDKVSHWYRKPLWVLLLASVVVAIIVNFGIGNPPEPTLKSLRDSADYFYKQGRYSNAEAAYLSLLLDTTSEAMFDLDLNRGFIISHFEADHHDSSKVRYLSDSEVVSMYRTLIEYDSSVGLYSYGLVMVYKDSQAQALQAFLAVPNREMKYVNNSTGAVYKEMDSLNQSVPYFRKEIALHGFIGTAYKNLFSVLRTQKNWSAVYNLLKDTASQQYCPPATASIAYFASGTIPEYVRFLVAHYLKVVNRFGFVGAFLILCAWLLYLRKIDLFESERWSYVIATLLLGIGCSFFIFPISDFFVATIGWQLNGSLLNDLGYCVGRIGAFEELVKLIPLLLLIRFTKAINEPIDYIIYGSISALGFAFAENLLYFQQNHLGIITGRALSAVVLHMFMTSTIAYGLVVSRDKRVPERVLYALGAFLLASTIHGVYDWILEDGTGYWRILAMALLALCILQYALYLRNCLNWSPFYDENKTYAAHKLKLYLCYSLAAVALFEYIAVAFASGSSVANKEILASIVSGTILIIWLSNRLGDLTLHQQERLEGFSCLLRGRISMPVKEGVAALGHVIFLGIIGVGVLSVATSKPGYLIVYGIRILFGFFGGSKDTTEAEHAEKAVA